MYYLFDEWERIKERIKDKYLFIFLDFDGTLVPVARTPQEAVLPKRAKELLGKLAKNPRLKLAFISGRALEDIKNRIGLKGIIYSGNHGLEIEGPKIKFEPVFSPRFRVIIERIKDGLQQRISSTEGAFIEDKGLSLSLHYRLVKKSRIPALKTLFYETASLYLLKNKIKVSEGKMVLEVRPPLEWDKGKVALWLLGRQIFALKDKSVLAVYIGDDTADEDAFRALKNNGLTVFVGKAAKESLAGYFLRDHNEVLELLTRILSIYND